MWVIIGVCFLAALLAAGRMRGGRTAQSIDDVQSETGTGPTAHMVDDAFKKPKY
jgi:hypothetical protein